MPLTRILGQPKSTQNCFSCAINNNKSLSSEMDLNTYILPAIYRTLPYQLEDFDCFPIITIIIFFTRKHYRNSCTSYYTNTVSYYLVPKLSNQTSIVSSECL